MPRPQVLRHHRLRRRTRYASIPVAGLPLTPTDIPLCWLTQPLTLRLDQPFTHAEVTQVDGATARADATGATVVYPFTATLTTAVDADPSNLASWIVTYFANPRMRSPSLTINLLYRTDAEKLMLLRVGRNQRIRLTGLPVEWPAGANTLAVRGIQHEATTYSRTLTWVTGPVVGASPGIPGPWFRRGTSARGGTDVRPF